MGAIDASGKSCDAPGARDHSFEIFRRPSNARNRASSGRGRLDGARDVEAFRGRRAGLGLDLGFIDDPIKGRAEAQSKVTRDKAWNWLTDDFFGRSATRPGC
jgi:hypothetical protein